MTLQEKYEKQKEINKELVDENEALKFAARMSEKTEKQLREKNKNLEARLNAINLLTPELEKEAKKKSQRIADLEKENAELKERLAEVNLNGNIVLRELTKAKELLAKWVELYKPKLEGYPITPIQEQTEQFLEEEA